MIEDDGNVQLQRPLSNECGCPEIGQRWNRGRARGLEFAEDRVDGD
jgi:hypothetical protein